MAVGLALLSTAGRARLGKRILVSGVVLLFLFSNRFVSMALLAPLEARFPAIPEFAPGAQPGALAGCVVVAVLGSGNSENSAIPATSQLSTSGLSRLVEAVRILSAMPGARMIVSGPAEPGMPSHASVLRLAAVSLGVDPSRISLLETARDTEEEAGAIAQMVRGQRIALVTSAWHMPRAAALFQRAHVDFVACPSNYLAAGASHQGITWAALGFDVDSLSRSTWAVHEWIGLAWTRFKPVPALLDSRVLSSPRP